MRSTGVEERRARLAHRHRLTPSARTDDDVAEVAGATVVLHATDPATVVLSALARMGEPDPGSVERALYEERTVLRMLGMRRTLFTAPLELVPVVHAAASRAVAAKERALLERMLVDGGITKRPGPWLRKVEAATLVALDELGEGSAPELAARVPDLDRQMTLAAGKRYEAKVRLSSRVLLVLGADGRVVRGRPRGSWITTTHRWARTEHWLGAPIDELDTEPARAELVRRWLARFGPGTVEDLQWWTGWTKGAVRAALAELDTAGVELDGRPGLVLAEDEAPAPRAEPWVALLPGLDPTPMAWKERDWYLGPYKAHVFDTAGNVGPTIWVDGRIVGGWAQRKDGTVVTQLLEDLPKRRVADVGRAAAALEDIIRSVPSIPRFPSPLDKQLRP